MPALPIRVTILAPSGEVLGWKMLTPSGGNWRALGRLPRVQVYRKRDNPFPARDCVPYGDGWAVRLMDGDPVPLNLETMEVEAK